MTMDGTRFGTDVNAGNFAYAASVAESNPSVALSPSIPQDNPRKNAASLHAFQARITQRIAQASASPSQEQARLHIKLGGLSVLLPLLEVGELLPVPDSSAIPMALPWMSGLAVVRAEVLLIVKLDYFLNQVARSIQLAAVNQRLAEHAGSMKNRKLVVIASNIANKVGFVAGSVEGAVYLDRDQIMPFEGGAQLAEFGFIKQVWKNSKGEPMVELSIDALMKSPLMQQTQLALQSA